MQNFKMIIGLLSNSERKKLMVVLIYVFIMAILESIGVASIMPFLAIASGPELIETNDVLRKVFHFSSQFGITTEDRFLIFTGVISFSLLFIGSIYKVFTLYQLNNFIEMRRYSISHALLNNYIKMPYEFFISRNTTGLSKEILSEVDIITQQILRPFVQMISYSIVAIALLSLLLFIEPLMSLLVIVIFGGLYASIYLLVRNKLKRIGKIRSVNNSKRFLAVSEGFGGIKSVKVDRTEDYFVDKYEQSARSFSQSQANAVTINQVPQYVVEAIAMGGVILVTIVAIIHLGGVRSAAFSELLPLLGVYVFAAYRLQPSLRAIYQGIASIKYGYSSLSSVHEGLSLQPSSSPNFRQTRSTKKQLPFEDRISLHGIQYQYPNTTQAALRNIELEIEKNSFVAVMGQSGSGKTTLVDTILGLLKHQAGKLRLDHEDITATNLESYRKKIGYVPQDAYLSDATIRENIAFGVPADQIDEKKIIEVSKMAELHDYCCNLELGYGSTVGERGANLSGGLRQRVGIARALYKNPEILVLDESTSALDTLTEQRLLKTISGLRGSMTIIFITHKPHIAHFFDKIIFMSKGEVLEIGSFEKISSRFPEVFIDLKGN